jgi:hypothetical protein
MIINFLKTYIEASPGTGIIKLAYLFKIFYGFVLKKTTTEDEMEATSIEENHVLRLRGKGTYCNVYKTNGCVDRQPKARARLYPIQHRLDRVYI